MKEGSQNTIKVSLDQITQQVNEPKHKVSFSQFPPLNPTNLKEIKIKNSNDIYQEIQEYEFKKTEHEEFDICNLAKKNGVLLQFLKSHPKVGSLNISNLI